MAYPSARIRRVQEWMLLNVIDENTDTANTWLPIHLSLLSFKVSTAMYLYLYVICNCIQRMRVIFLRLFLYRVLWEPPRFAEQARLLWRIDGLFLVWGEKFSFSIFGFCFCFCFGYPFSLFLFSVSICLRLNVSANTCSKRQCLTLTARA